LATPNIDDRLVGWLKKLNDELDARRRMVRRLDHYYLGYPDVPEHVSQIKLEPEYRVLLRQAVTNWPELIVDSVEERLEVVAFDFGDKTLSDKVWSLWQANDLDAASGLVHRAALVNGRSYAIVWAGENGEPEVVPEHASTTVVAYELPSARRRAAALRRWQEDGRWFCTLYLPDGLYKFQGKSKKDQPGTVPPADDWVVREVQGERWPLVNPLKVVPVVEFGANRNLSPYRVAPGQTIWEPPQQSREFGHTVSGEFERVLPIVDRINTTIFNGLLAQAWSSFPVRALIGDEIKYVEKKDSQGNTVLDANDKPILEAAPPFKVAINRLIQIENPDGRLVQLPEANLDNFTKFAEAHVRHLAAITKTPAHYLLGEMINLSADAIRAAEAGLISKVRDHHLSFGESWEEVMQLAMAVGGDSAADTPDAEVQWKDPESRSWAERADASAKLQQLLPWQAIAEKILNATPQEIAKWEAMRAKDGLDALIAKPITPRELLTAQQAQAEEAGKPIPPGAPAAGSQGGGAQ
jgi:hypothetical protein